MQVSRILYPVEVLGPGKRIGVWLCGCPHACPGCSNPELWRPRAEYEMPVERLIALLRQMANTRQVDGFTLTGGDPFYQADALRTLLPELRAITPDVLVYTGYTHEELLERCPDVLAHVGVLIDGPYVERLNDGALLRGSSNQRILILDESLRPRYDACLAEAKNGVQNFTTRDGVVSVGIHRPGYENDLHARLTRKGLTDQ